MLVLCLWVKLEMKNEFYPQFWVILLVKFGNYIHCYGLNLHMGKFVETVEESGAVGKICKFLE
jgi:hypothetical protein